MEKERERVTGERERERGRERRGVGGERERERERERRGLGGEKETGGGGGGGGREGERKGERGGGGGGRFRYRSRRLTLINGVKLTHTHTHTHTQRRRESEREPINGQPRVPAETDRDTGSRGEGSSQPSAVVPAVLLRAALRGYGGLLVPKVEEFFVVFSLDSGASRLINTNMRKLLNSTS